MGPCIWDKPAKVPAARRNGQLPLPEEYLVTGDIVLIENQASLGWLQEVTPWGYPFHDGVQVQLDVGKGLKVHCHFPYPSIIIYHL